MTAATMNPAMCRSSWIWTATEYRIDDMLTTETKNPRTGAIDPNDTPALLRLMNEEDRLVPLAVEAELPRIAETVELAVNALAHNGRVIYVGAGTSGRLGVLDASECPPTFGVSPKLVQGFIAGGDVALRSAVEGAEDDPEAGAALMDELGIGEDDLVIGISASGSARFVIGAVTRAKALGAATAAIVNNAGTRLGACVDVCIAPIVGPEVIAGSTRMKSGTAQKLVLNMISTATMVRLGYAKGGVMTSLAATNEKLRGRAVRILCETAGVSEAAAEDALVRSDMRVDRALELLRTAAERKD
ncbi:MAG: N-acetylmuramic acid 6-phosphate etherase [bacterium]|nr:N-acetylmuramic acid 6-phosphate etherase [bacterium]